MFLRVLLTGFPDTNKKAAQYLEACGNQAVHFPLQEMNIISGSIKLLGKSDWVIFTSPSAVRLYMQHLYPLNPFVKAACVGPATAKALEDDYARACSLIPKGEYSASSLAREILINKKDFLGKKILFPCSKLAGNELLQMLSNEGILIRRYDFYSPSVNEQQAIPEFDALAFFSSSGVEAFFSQSFEIDLSTKKISVIGESTAITLRQYFSGDFMLASKASSVETVKALLKK